MVSVISYKSKNWKKFQRMFSLGKQGSKSLNLTILWSKEPPCQSRRWKRCGFDPWVQNTPWRRLWQPTLAFLPRESHEQRSLVGYSPQGCKKLEMTEATWHTQIFFTAPGTGLDRSLFFSVNRWSSMQLC